jgi:hypothetical protein
VDPDRETLGESVVLWLGEAIPKQGLADQDESERALAIEVVGGQEPEILEGVVGEQVGLVDEQDGAFWEPTEVGDQGRGGLALEAGGAEPGGGGDLGDEPEGADGGQTDVEDVVAGGVEGAGEERGGGALATAALADQEGGCIAADGEAETLEGVRERRVAEQAGSRGCLGEGDVSEPEVVLKRSGHGLGPFLVRTRTRCALIASR